MQWGPREEINNPLFCQVRLMLCVCVFVCAGWQWMISVCCGRRRPSVRQRVQLCLLFWPAPPAGSGPVFRTSTPCWGSGPAWVTWTHWDSFTPRAFTLSDTHLCIWSSVHLSDIIMKTPPVFQVPWPGAEADSCSVDGLHLRSRTAGLPASTRPGEVASFIFSSLLLVAVGKPPLSL